MKQRPYASSQRASWRYPEALSNAARPGRGYHAAIIAALQDPQIHQRFVDLGFEIVGNTPAQFADFQAQEYKRWKQVIETGKITAD